MENIFLEEDKYIDFSSENILQKVKEIEKFSTTEAQKVKNAYKFVRDEIPHSFDINADVITAKASDVLRHKTGICHAKSNLLAALLRCMGIPCGFRFEHITLADDDSMGYCVHAFNAVYLQNKWIELDARGNKEGVNAQFSLCKPILAFPLRKQYNEYFFDGIYAKSHIDTMRMLEKAKNIQDVFNNIPEFVYEKPDIVL